MRIGKQNLRPKLINMYMLLIELFQNQPLRILHEAPSRARRPEKLSGHRAAVNFLKDKNLENYGVSMTTQQKLGINPKSTFDTPLGIYFYPAEYYVNTKGEEGMGSLPYANNADYINIFELTGSIVYISAFEEDTYNSYISKLYTNIGEVSRLLGVNETATRKKIDAAIAGQGDALVDSWGGYFWYVLFSVCGSSNNRDRVVGRSPVIWNSVLRLLGIDTVIDVGGGIIHDNEPTQGVVLDTKHIRHAITIPNFDTKATANLTPDSNPIIAKIAQMKVDADRQKYINKVEDYIDDHGLVYDQADDWACNKIMNNVLAIFRQDPSTYVNCSGSCIKHILQLNNKPDVAKEITVSYYVKNFHVLQGNLGYLIEDINSNLAVLKRLKNGEVIKKFIGQPLASIQQDMIDSMKTFYRHELNVVVNSIAALTPFTGNTEADTVLTFLNDILVKSKLAV